jgi:transposase-like protein
MRGHGQKLTRKQEALIAALLSEPTQAAAARKAGVSEATMYRWLHQPSFQAGYRQARRDLIEHAVGRMQAVTGQAVDTLLAVAQSGRKDSDRVRAAVALLEHALRGLEHADALHNGHPTPEADAPLAIEGTGDVVKLLAQRLACVDRAELSTHDKSRLSAALADVLLRAIGVNMLDRRLEALQAVLIGRQDSEEKGNR